MQRPDHRKPFALAAVLATGALLVGCRSSTDSFVVDGVALHERHTDTLELSDWGAVPVVLESSFGDILVRATDGPGSIEIELHEKTPGDARARFENGRIRVETLSGEPYAIGTITVSAPAHVQALSARTSMGDVEVLGMRVTDRLELFSSMGSVRAVDTVAGGNAALKTSMGTVVATGLRCASLTADSGMGSVSVSDSVTGEAVLVSGMGAVKAESSVFEHLQAKSGMGDVDVSGSTYTSSDLSSGMGSVRTGS